MKKIVFAYAAIACAIATCSASLINDLNDIQNWTGSGSNRAGFIVQWNDGPSPAALAWGYRWSGNATGYDMLTAIAGSWTVTDSNDPSNILGSGSGSDARLTVGIQDFGWGTAVNSITFSSAGVTRTRSDWASGYWEYFNVGGSFDTPPNSDPNTFLGTQNYPGADTNSNWVSSYSGFSSRALSDGSWDAWSFAPNFVSNSVVQAYDSASYPTGAVPEPSQVASMLLVLAAIATCLAKKRFVKARSA